MDNLLSTPHLLRRILSYCVDGKSCLFFGMTCRNLFTEYSTMMRVSSHMKYRLAFANRDKCFISPEVSTWEKHRFFDIFDPPLSIPIKYNLDEEFYVTSIEEYEKSIVSSSKKEDDGAEDLELDYNDDKRSKIQKIIDDKFTPVVLDILSDINKEHPFSCMISGSFAMLHFLQTKNFKSHSKKVNRQFNLELEKKIPHLYSTPEERNAKYITGVPNYFENQDIDVFILSSGGSGDLRKKSCNKTYICEKILLELNRSLDEQIKSNIQVTSRRGCTDIYLRLPEAQITQKKYKKVLQLVMKRRASQPIDIFSFFDLDCCKIGYFPGNKKVVATPRFIQSITKFMNFADLQFQKVSNRHKTRISKYYFRLGFRTSIEVPHPMSFFHTFSPIVDAMTYHAVDFYKWGDFFIDGKGTTYLLPGKFPSGYHRTFSKKPWYPGFNTIYDDPMNPKIEPVLNNKAMYFHFCEFETKEKIPHDTDKRKDVDVGAGYTASEDDDECNKKEKMFRLDIVKMMIEIRRDKDNIIRERKEYEKRMRHTHKKWMDVFQIGEVNFSYYYNCYGLTSRRRRRVNGESIEIFGYFDKIFPRRVKALLAFDREKKLFEPVFLKRYKCAQCGVVNMNMDRPYQTCGRCKDMFYCSRKCQIKHWKTHKLKCVKIEEE